MHKSTKQGGCTASPAFLTMKKIIILCLIGALCLSLSGCKTGPQRYTEYSFDYFDTVTTVLGYADSKEEFDAVYDEIKAQLQEYHRLYNIYERYDGVNNLCAVNEVREGAHKTVQVDQKIIDLLLYAKEIYRETDGRVNVAMGSVLSIWHDYRTEGMKDPSAARLPSMTELKQAAAHVNIEDVILDRENKTVFLADPELKLDVGAIAKGYACEMVAQSLEQRGIIGYFLNLGGNLRAIGEKPDGGLWTAGIENPDRDDTENPYIATLSLKNQALVTSGNYQRFYTVDGKNYHHIIDGETLMPGERYRSVSVLSAHSGQADGLSTALFLMDLEEGRQFVERLDGVEALWVLPDGTLQYSSGFPQ